MITDAINLILIDTNNTSYINKFTIKMLAPTTQEEVDRRDNIVNKVGLVGDIMNSLSDVEDPITRLKIVKSLLSDTINNVEVISLVQDQIDNLEAAEEEVPEENVVEGTEDDDLSDLFSDEDTQFDTSETPSETVPDESTPDMSDEENDLPSPADLGIGDVSDSTNPEFEF